MRHRKVSIEYLVSFKTLASLYTLRTHVSLLTLVEDLQKTVSLKGQEGYWCYLSAQSSIKVGNTLLTFLSLHSIDSLQNKQQDSRTVAQKVKNRDCHHFSIGSNESWRSLGSIRSGRACISLHRQMTSPVSTVGSGYVPHGLPVSLGLQPSQGHRWGLGRPHRPSFPWDPAFQVLLGLHYLPTHSD